MLKEYLSFSQFWRRFIHDVVVVGIPLIVILAGIVFGRADIKEPRKDYQRLEDKTDALRSDMNARFDKVNARFDRIDDHLIQFHSITGKLDGRLDSIERQRG